MLQRLRALRKSESGFTLTELLIVIVILGILTGIVVFAVGAFQDRGQAAACKSDKKATEVAVEAFKAKSAVSAYPPDLTALVPGYLREEPPQVVGDPEAYFITYTAATGAVAAQLDGGGAC